MRKINYPKRGSSDFKTLTTAYLGIYSKKALTMMQKRWYNWKRKNGVNNIPETVRKLLTADVNVLADVYERFVALPIPSTLPGPNGKDVRSDAYNELDGIFNYSDKYSSKIATFFCNHADDLNISSCHYCELAYVNTYDVIDGSDAKKHKHFDLDHFLPKSKCPILGLSLFNFVPSCQVCNSRIKSNNTIGADKLEWVQFSPVSETYNFDKDVTIRLRMHTGPDTKFRKKGEYYIYFRCKNNFDVPVKAFHLEERYEFHKIEAMRLRQLKAQYPLSARRKIAKLLGFSEAKVKEDIFHEKFLKENDRCFAKLTRDMLK